MNIYAIRILGHLNANCHDWFDLAEAHALPTGETVLCVRAPDQAALLGVLYRLHAWSIRILAFTLITPET